MNGTRVGTDFKLGSSVTYQCDPGYRIAEASSITCVLGADGKPAWNQALPTCRGRCAGGSPARRALRSQLPVHTPARRAVAPVGGAGCRAEGAPERPPCVL